MKVNDFAKRLELAGISNAWQETLWLVSAALGLNSAQILAKSSFSQEDLAKIDPLITRRELGEPLQYITGEATFFGRDFHVGQGVLIPRQDTETLILAVMRLFHQQDTFSFIDWGTGSGCIAVTLLLEFPHSFAFLLENNSTAAQFAHFNLLRYGLTQRAKILSLHYDIPPCHLLISNPPYIPSQHINNLMRDVRDFEPISALDGGEDGLKFYPQIFSLACLKQCHYLVLETGTLYQVKSLAAYNNTFSLWDMVYDNHSFPRALTFIKEGDHEKTYC